MAAACRNPLTNGPRTDAGSPADRMAAWLLSAVTSRFCSSAPTAAVPMTEPTWRTVLIMPDAAPAIRGSTSRIATVVIGANVPPMPRPATIIGARKSCRRECGPARVSFIDSSGLAGFVRIRKAVPPDCPVVIRSPQRRVRRLFKITGLDSVIAFE